MKARKNYVREWRLLRGKTQQQVADLAGIKAMTLSNLECRRTVRPHRTTLLLVARVLGVHQRDLFVRPAAFKGADDGGQQGTGRGRRSARP